MMVIYNLQGISYLQTLIIKPKIFLLYKLKNYQNNFNCAQNRPNQMIYPTKHLISQHFSSQMLHPLDPQQVDSTSVKKQHYSRKTLKQMNQLFSEEEVQVGKVEEDSLEFRKQKTFYCHPDDQINQGCSFENLIPQSQEFEQNPQKNSSRKHHFSEYNKSEYYTTQTMIDLLQIPRRRQESIKQMCQTQQQTGLNSLQEDNIKMTQSEQMIEQFDRQQLQSRSFLSSIKPNKNNQVKQYQQQNNIPLIIIKQDLDHNNNSQLIPKRRSKLRQIQQKIQNEKKLSNINSPGRFNLKQFHLKQQISRQISGNVKKLQNQQFKKVIFERIQGEDNVTIIGQLQRKTETQKLVEMLTLAIMPQFQRLQNQYKGEMSKIQQKIQRITKNTSQYNLLSSVRSKNVSKMIGSLNNKQSVIRINLNEDFQMNQDDVLRLDLIEEEIMDDYQRHQDELLAPMIKRTESEDQLLISCRSEMSDV